MGYMESIPSVASSTAYEASRVVKAGPGRLLTLSGFNSKGSAQFIQVHNAAALPADTAVPLFTGTVPTVGNFLFDFGSLGIPCSVGITLSNSSTGPTKTIGSADCWFVATYL